MLRFFEPEVESRWPFSTTCSSYEPMVHGSNEPWQPLSSNAFSELEVLFNGGFFANPNGLQTQDFHMDSLSCSPVISFDAPGSRTSIRSSNQHPNLEEIPTREPKRLKTTPPQKPGKPMKAPIGKSQKLGDKITSLQQLVSPFGKTDTCSISATRGFNLYQDTCMNRSIQPLLESEHHLMSFSMEEGEFACKKEGYAWSQSQQP